MKIVIAGYGAVGKAIYECLYESNADLFVDDPALGHHVDTDVMKPDAVVVCVATPMREDGSCNTDHVEEVFTKYNGVKYLIKSAVDPVWLVNWANTHSGSYTYSPEFLRGSHTHAEPTQEFLDSEFAIYGGDDCRWWDELFRPHLSRLKDVKYVTLEQAAFGKYVENCFLATKVTFFNHMYKIYHSLGFKGFDQMVDAITLDPRIGRSHTQIPGPDGKFGYGGHCLPKDVAALRHLSKGSPFLTVIEELNKKHREGE